MQYIFLTPSIYRRIHLVIKICEALLSSRGLLKICVYQEVQIVFKENIYVKIIICLTEDAHNLWISINHKVHLGTIMFHIKKLESNLHMLLSNKREYIWLRGSLCKMSFKSWLESCVDSSLLSYN